MTAESILIRLQKGNKNFVEDNLQRNIQTMSNRKSLVKGQSPHTIVLNCSDSRVVPELIFDAGLGELFVVRVAGNVANTCSIASIEYAVAHLKSIVLIVLGHESCGAIKAAVDGGDCGHNLNHLLGHISPAINASEKNASVTDITKKNAQLTTQELMNQSSIIKDAVELGNLKIVSAYYHLSTGKVDFLDL